MEMKGPTIRFVDAEVDAGVEIEYDQRVKEFIVSGWYDSVQRIDPTCISLEDLCRQFGITKKDLPPWAE